MCPEKHSLSPYAPWPCLSSSQLSACRRKLLGWCVVFLDLSLPLPPFPLFLFSFFLLYFCAHGGPWSRSHFLSLCQSTLCCLLVNDRFKQGSISEVTTSLPFQQCKQRTAEAPLASTWKNICFALGREAVFCHWWVHWRFSLVPAEAKASPVVKLSQRRIQATAGKDAMMAPLENIPLMPPKPLCPSKPVYCCHSRQFVSCFSPALTFSFVVC